MSSIQGYGSSLNSIDYSAMLQRLQNLKGPTKDDLTQFEQKLKSAGDDTSNIDKLITNFDQVSTNGSLDPSKVQANAQTLGLQVPQGNFGPPPGLFGLSGCGNGDGDADDANKTTSATSAASGTNPSSTTGPTLDDLTKLDQTLKSAGVNTDNLDKLIANFNQVSTDGKLDPSKVQADAQTLGLKPHHRHGGHHGGFGPPPGLISSTDSNGVSSAISTSNNNSSTTSSDATGNQSLLNILASQLGQGNNSNGLNVIASLFQKLDPGNLVQSSVQSLFA